MEINHKAIVKRIFDIHSDHLNDWESEFIENLYLNWTGEYTDAQKEIIIRINRKILRG